MEISFHGANRSVTGSCHLIKCAGLNVLIDCGMYQGEKELEKKNAADFGFDPASIDYLLLTHAHLDHCGRIPLLCKRGFTGEIITTSASAELARLMMLDAAHINEEEARYQARKKERQSGRPLNVQPLPLYSILDALNSAELFGRKASYNQPLTLAPGINATFIDAGHILGSACIYLELEEQGHRRTILFSGDLGNIDRPFLHNSATPPKADIVVMETTYGNRRHKTMTPTVKEFYEAITETFKHGGNIIIPTFALERAQEILFYIHKGIIQNRLPSFTQVFLDSPMAISATEIFERHPEYYKASASKEFHKDNTMFEFPGLHFVRETSESIALNQFNGNAIIMAGSGMCTGGRIRHHLRHHLGNKKSSIIFVGYAAIGTLARQIIDGAETVQIFGETISVRAKIYTINGFSAHADQAELLSWHQKINPTVTYLVHGDEKVMREFSKLLPHTQVEMPTLGQRFPIF